MGESYVAAQGVASGETPTGGARPEGRRRRVAFVVVFLSTATALLVAYRYAGDSLFMDRYLFLIARQTAAVLSLFGESARVEDPGLYRGREAEIRRSLGRPEDPDTPLTSWETWRFRAESARRGVRALETRLARLESIPPRPDSPSSDYVAWLNDRLAQFEKAARPPASRSPSPAEGAAIARTVRLRAALGSAHPHSRNAAAMARIEGALDEASAELATALHGEAARQKARLRGEGPRVHYVARSGKARRLAMLRSELREARADLFAASAKAQARIDALEARIAAVRSESGGSADDDRSFVFRVVADCGAIPSMSIFLAAVAAFPAPWRRRLLGVVVGLPLLYGVNILRLACLGMLGARIGAGPWFDFAHKYVWQGLYIVFVVALWLVWVECIVRGRRLWKSPSP